MGESYDEGEPRFGEKEGGQRGSIGCSQLYTEERRVQGGRASKENLHRRRKHERVSGRNGSPAGSGSSKVVVSLQVWPN